MIIVPTYSIKTHPETFLVVATGAGKGARSCHWYLVSGGQGWWKASWNPRDIAAYCNYLAPHANGVGVEKPSGQWEHEQVVANDQSLPLEESILWYSISVVVAMLYSYLTYFFSLSESKHHFYLHFIIKLVESVPYLTHIQ